jgi:small GTP-binding protein
MALVHLRTLGSQRAVQRIRCHSAGNSIATLYSSTSFVSFPPPSFRSTFQQVTSFSIPTSSHHSGVHLRLLRHFSSQLPSFDNPELGHLRRVLNDEQNAVLKKEIALLEQLHSDLTRADANHTDLDEVKKSIQHLKELFLLVVVGEFNSGKSTALNALLGAKFLQEGVTPTTSRINLISYGTEVARSLYNEGRGEDELQLVNLPIDWLKEINLVDTPGTNAIFKSHQMLTENFIPRSDLILFVTSSDRPFSDSERSFLERIRTWRKKVVVVLSKIDNLESEAQVQEIVNFLLQNIKATLGFEPTVFPVSARHALRAKLKNKEAIVAEKQQQPLTPLDQQHDWKISNYSALESFIFDTLNAEQRALLKLQNPIGIAENLIDKYTVEIQKRRTLLEKDLVVLKSIEDQLEIFRKDILQGRGSL